MNISQLDFSKTYNYADYLMWKFEERIELIKGKLFKMSPAPSTIHQKVFSVVFTKMYVFLERKKCQVFPAPFDVRLPRKSKEDKEVITVLQPDICVICDASKIDDKGCIGAPDIVVEILSPGNNKKELKNKYEVYEESGVKEYWIIHPSEKTFFKYTLSDDGKYLPSRLMISGDQVTTPVLPGFILNLEDVFGNDEDELL